MKLFDQLIARAGSADRKAGELANRELEREERRKAIARIETIFEQMAADGELDKGEIEELKRTFRAAGLDAESLAQLLRELEGRDETARVPVTDRLRREIQGTLFDAKSTTHDPRFLFEVQATMSEYQLSIDLASRVSKSEHEIYMTAIRNLVA